MLNKILLITTPGCKGCEIMDNIIRKALKDERLSKYDITYIVVSEQQFGSKFKTELELTDFPTTLFIQHNLFKSDNINIKNKIVGTAPVGSIIETAIGSF